MNTFTIQTKRLILRQWTENDFMPFAKLNADSKVMEFFPSVLSEEESHQIAKKLQKKIEEKGWGLWAVNLKESHEFIGFIGLDEPSFNAHFTPSIEIGWRLAYPFWGKGYAKEGASACLRYGFETLKLNEIVSFTTVHNLRSRKVMESIGMHHNPKDDFDHPKIPLEHPLCRHVLYRLKAEEWNQKISIFN